MTMDEGTQRSAALHPHGPALLLGISMACLAYAAAQILGGPLLAYLPMEGRWTFAPPPGAVQIRFFGLLLDGAAGFLLGYGIGRVCVAPGGLGRPAAVRALAAAAAGTFVIGLAALAIFELGHALG